MSDKTRQSSGGKSFFSRRKNKDDVPETPGLPSNLNPQSSRHQHRSSVNSINGGSPSQRPISYLPEHIHSAGVLTSIPYDSVPPDGRSPVAVDFLPKDTSAAAAAARREPLPHHLNKGGVDFHQLAEWQGEQRRRQNARQTQFSVDGMGILGRADEEGSPEWYVRKVLDNSITAKQLQSLSVSLRTQPIGWVKAFVEAQGQIALTNVLNKINRRQGQGPAPSGSQSNTDKDLDREYDIVKCLKALMNNKYGADNALSYPQIVTSLAASLISPRLNTRKLVSEVLTFLCHWANGQGHEKVLQALDQLKQAQGENGRFDAWMRIVEVTVDGRGKMGSLVGASDEARSGGIGFENLLMEYAVASLFLVNMIVDAPERDLQLRVHLRAQFTACGIKRILTKMEGFQYEVIDKQVERYRTNEAIDYEDLLERENSSMVDSIEGEVKDMNDPSQIVDAIQNKIHGTRAQDYFLSAMQHLLLIRDNEGEDRLRLFQLVDSMLSYVAMDRRLPDMDLKQSLNFTVQSLLDKLYTDSEARQARDEAIEARQIADAAVAERDEMRAQLELGADGVVGKLQKQMEEQNALLELRGRQIKQLKAELSDLQTVRAKELQRNELETRELYLMLRDAQDVAASAAAKKGKDGKPGQADPIIMQGILDREKLLDKLEMQLERSKTQAKLEGKVWQAVDPGDKLRELREKMDGYEEENNKADFSRADYTNSFLGTVNRKPVPKRPTGDDTDAEYEDEDMVVEKPRLVELRRPKMSSTQQGALLGEIASKVKKLDDSDDEADAEGDGVTTGPTHPSVDSESPKTPADGEKFNARRGPGFLPQPGYAGTQKVGLAVARPKKKLKALHWDKVDTPQVTMWASHAPTYEAKEEKYKELSKRGVLDEVEKLFLAKEIKQIGKKQSAKNDKKQLISNDLVKGFHVALSKFNQHSADEVVRMIIHCDKPILENDVVIEFLQRTELCNIPENVSKQMAPYAKDWTGPDAANATRESDPAELTREDQIYLYTAYELHHYWKSRMRALELTRTYEAEYDDIFTKLQEVVRVSDSLRDSVSLMNVLGLILDIGNYMNDANKQATGFKLSSLARLGMVKDDKNESTFADLVERIVRNQYPEWEGFVDEITGVIAAQKINVEQLTLDAKKYIDNIKNVQGSLDSGNLSDPKKFHPEDRVSIIVQRCMKDARRKAEAMADYLEDMKKTYDDILTFYGEDPTDENARREFFAKLAVFVNEWRKSREKNIKWEETRRRNEENMRRKAQQAPRSPTADGPLLSPASTGAMDTLLEKLRAAAPQTRDQRDRRRRARLKDRHQVRVASGQKMPELPGVSVDGEEGSSAGANGLLSPNSIASGDNSGDTGGEGDEREKGDKNGGNSEGEDIADRAAVMLQGLRGDEVSEVPGRDDSIRIRRRRENAGNERESRRRRRARQGGSTADETIKEEPGSPRAGDGDTDSRPGTGYSRPGTAHTNATTDSVADSEQTKPDTEPDMEADGEKTALPSPPPEKQDEDEPMPDADADVEASTKEAGKDDDRPESPLPTPVTIVSPPSPGREDKNDLPPVPPKDEE
ncbi:putative cytokinesis protein sepa protein [Neofusicoccum parvum UCRNP2]|uniref:Putative cytokinesis protein sepa protein n=1 Tax=Botryosphaeria parva (strain UCR-NP2) TaxID=1287680 RepID=R1E594_BOTPV|nr:putative cytokinesis protein sepa protein [Neofusicoccum parvum UCRNP2]